MFGSVEEIENATREDVILYLEDGGLLATMKKAPAFSKLLPLIPLIQKDTKKKKSKPIRRHIGTRAQAMTVERVLGGSPLLFYPNP